jgi:tRNA threonylcarbamoyl adenosine modification protein YjeE
MTRKLQCDKKDNGFLEILGIKNLFSTKNIAVIAMLTALSFVLYMFAKFPLPFIFPGFLDMQFSDLPALLGGFSLGPCSGGIIIIVKCLLKMPFSSTACVGELADVIIGLANVLPATLFYRFFRSRKGAILSLCLGAISAIVFSLLSNAFILIPFYSKAYGMDVIVKMVESLYQGVSGENFLSYYLPLAVLPFNAIRCLFCAILTYFTYKPLSRALKWESKKKETKKEFTSLNQEQTEEIAFDYAKTLKKGDVVLLSGDLGAGKTAFTKGVAKYFGLDEVTSPTYAYLNVYGDILYHYDCYRLSSGEDAEMLGLTDYFGGDNICIIEWSENIKEVLPKNCKKVQIIKLGENERKIIL